MLERVFAHENLGYEIELPEDTSLWTGEMNKILFTSYPELANFPAKLVIDKFEPQKLYAKGSFVIDVSGKIITIPVIVKNKKLQPFDLALIDEEWCYLTNDLLTNLINGNVSMGEAVETKDTVDYNDQAINNSIPNSAGSRNYREITASIITQHDQRALAETLLSDKHVKQAAKENPAFNNVIQSILKKDIKAYKCAFVTRDSFLNSSIYVTDNKNKREKISASFADAKAFVKRHMPEQYIDFIKTGSAGMFPGCDSSESFGLSGIGSIINKMMQKVQNPGMFNLLNSSGTEPVMVIKIKSISGDDAGLMGLGDKGSIIDDISELEAIPSQDSDTNIKDSLESISPEGMSEGDDILTENNTGDFIEPITVDKTMELPFGKVILGKTKAGGDMFVGIILSKFNKNKTAASYENLLPKGVTPVILSPDAKFYKLAEASNTYIQSKKECLAALTKSASVVSVIRRDNNTLAIKTASEAITCDKNAAPYFLASYGISQKDISEGLESLETATKTAFVLPKKHPHKLSKKLAAVIKKVPWLKIATYMDSEESVDNALALNYLDDDTSSEFYEQVPVYKKALASMAKLMASVRLGNSIISEEILKNAMEALDGLISELTIYREGA